MAAKFVVFIALLALANAAMVRRDAPTQADSEVKNNFNMLVDQLKALSVSLNAAISDATGKVKESVESTKQKVDQSVADLRKAHPEVEQQAGQVSEQARTAIAAGVKNVESLAKEVQANAESTYQKLAPTIKEAADNIIKNIGELQKKLLDSTKLQDSTKQ